LIEIPSSYSGEGRLRDDSSKKDSAGKKLGGEVDLNRRQFQASKTGGGSATRPTHVEQAKDGGAKVHRVREPGVDGPRANCVKPGRGKIGRAKKKRRQTKKNEAFSEKKL